MSSGAELSARLDQWWQEAGQRGGLLWPGTGPSGRFRGRAHLILGSAGSQKLETKDVSDIGDSFLQSLQPGPGQKVYSLKGPLDVVELEPWDDWNGSCSTYLSSIYNPT